MPTGIANELLEGTVLEIDTTVLPRITVDLSDLGKDTPPGLATRLLRPRYTIRRDNTVLLVSQPAGAPEEKRGELVLVVLGLAALVMFFVG